MAPNRGADPDAERRRALRRIARRHHPDVGGDLGAYLEAVAALERRMTSPAGATPVTVRRANGLHRAARRLRRLLRARRAERRDRRRAGVDEKLARARGGAGRSPGRGLRVRLRRRRASR